MILNGTGCLYMYMYAHTVYTQQCYLLGSFLSHLEAIQELSIDSNANPDGAFVFLSAFAPAGLGALLNLILISFLFLVVEQFGTGPSKTLLTPPAWSLISSVGKHH